MDRFWVQVSVQMQFLGTTPVVDQLSFSMIPSILTFEFDLILGSFMTFWIPNGLFLGSRLDKKKNFFWSTHVVEQLSFSMFP